ncbi:PREDICTED: MATH domain and coiled-coil domain-containing protein At2g42470-like [Camelina sativa]|uniref:MATH domain and coiled-coil domain-containing protein At2g42470-like n=1 Tax=Camelina sativa TaxID=90675 RepID=A0ABM1RSI8_CAMSA|nr:PREDICTED: MATH domain and coiled-coil domain-containing protein At2g42470-like [Camelina sativa]
MENYEKTSFRFEIDNFSEKKAEISSPIFISGGCEWFITVHPKGCPIEDYLSVYLHVANHDSLRTGWKIRANYSFTVLNQSLRELKRTTEACDLFCAVVPGWGYPKVLPVVKLQEEGYFEKKKPSFSSSQFSGWGQDKLIIQVEIKVVEDVHEEELTGKEMLDFNGFPILYTQLASVSKIFVNHMDFAECFRPKDKGVKTAYMNLLLSLIETLCKPPLSFSETELSNARNELNELTEAGFKLDWLEAKLDEVSLERKNATANSYRVEELEARIKNLELTLSDLKVELNKEKKTKFTEILSFDDIVGSRNYQI